MQQQVVLSRQQQIIQLQQWQLSQLLGQRQAMTPPSDASSAFLAWNSTPDLQHDLSSSEVLFCPPGASLSYAAGSMTSPISGPGDSFIEAATKSLLCLQHQPDAPMETKVTNEVPQVAWGNHLGFEGTGLPMEEGKRSAHQLQQEQQQQQQQQQQQLDLQRLTRDALSINAELGAMLSSKEVCVGTAYPLPPTVCHGGSQDIWGDCCSPGFPSETDSDLSSAGPMAMNYSMGTDVEFLFRDEDLFKNTAHIF